MNVLLTSVGRRSYLVDYFKQAVQPSGRVIAANSEPLTSGMIAADKAYTVPRVDSADYISAILDICRKESVGLVVSLFDIDLPYLAKARDQFSAAGIQLVVSEPWVVDVANDKWRTWEYLSENGVASPKTYLSLDSAKFDLNSGLLSYPLMIKPRWGMGSMSVFRADDYEEFAFFYDYTRRQIEKSYLNILSHEQLAESVVIQDFIAGKEYGLDVFNDLNGNYLQTIAKQKLAMRAGETDIAIILDDQRLVALGEELAGLLQHRGNVDVDVLEDSKGNLYVLEMNARFGGGYPFSHTAGADYPAALVALASGKVPILNSPKVGCRGGKAIAMLEVGQ